MPTSSYALRTFSLGWRRERERRGELTFGSWLVQGSKFMTKWSHMRSKFMGCDSIVNAIRTVRIQ
jgi:hypothetical protein